MVASRADVDVLGDRAHADDAFLLAVFRAEDQAVADGVADVRGLHRLAVHGDRAGEAAVGAVHGAHHFRATRADEAEEADDLARTHVEAHGALHDVAGDVLDREADIAVLAGLVAPDVADVATDHALHEGVAGDTFERVEVGHLAAVAEDRRGVAQLEDLVEAMRDVDHRLALRAQVAHEAEQHVGLAVRQRAGGFVEREDGGVAQDRLDDLHHLPLADGELAQLRAWIEIHAQRIEAFARPGERAPTVHEAEARGQATEQQVFHHRQFGDVLQFLVDHGHAGTDGVGGAAKRLHVAVDGDSALVGNVFPAEDLHHRGLAGAVLAQQAVHATGAHGEAHVGERAHAGKTLPDMAKFQARRAAHGQSPISLRTSATLPRVIRRPVVSVRAGGALSFLIHSYMSIEVS